MTAPPDIRFAEIRSADIWAVVPMKVTTGSKQRLSAALPPDDRRRLALAMFADVLDALTRAPGLAGIVVVTLDPDVTDLARRAGVRVVTEGAADGHTGAVAAAARLLAAEGRAGMLALPGDVPLLAPDDVAALLDGRAPAPSLTITPAHDGRGSNAMLLLPPDAMTPRYGGDSFVPHLRDAARLGLATRIVERPNVALDVDDPADLAAFRTACRARGGGTRAAAFLDALPVPAGHPEGPA